MMRIAFQFFNPWVTSCTGSHPCSLLDSGRYQDRNKFHLACEVGRPAIQFQHTCKEARLQNPGLFFTATKRSAYGTEKQRKRYQKSELETQVTLDALMEFFDDLINRKLLTESRTKAVSTHREHSRTVSCQRKVEHNNFPARRGSVGEETV